MGGCGSAGRCASCSFYLCCMVPFGFKKIFLRRATPFDTGVLGCLGVFGVSKGVGGNFRVSQKKIIPTFCVKLLFTR